MTKSAAAALVFTLLLCLLPGTARGNTLGNYTNGMGLNGPAGQFDLVWRLYNDYDANGLPVNPIWNATLLSLWSRSQVAYPSYSDDCGSQTPPGCTVQQTWFNPANTAFQIFGVCKPDPVAGHVNWRAVTDMGNIWWNDWSGPWPQDNDINMWLLPSVPSLLDLSNTASLALSNGQAAVGLEFDASETIDNFSTAFWKTPYLSTINGNLAVATGLLGIDGVHDGGWVELHPVFALAILIGSAPYLDQDGTFHDTDLWMYFIRTTGDEGGCGGLSASWMGNQGIWYLDLPLPGLLPFSKTGGGMVSPWSTNVDFVYPQVQSWSGSFVNYTNSSGYVIAPPGATNSQVTTALYQVTPLSLGAGPNGAPAERMPFIFLPFSFPAPPSGDFSYGMVLNQYAYKLPALPPGVALPPRNLPHSNVTLPTAWHGPAPPKGWHEPNEPADIMATIQDPTLLLRLQALLDANPPPAPPVVHALYRGSVPFAPKPAATLPPLRAQDVVRLSTVRPFADPARQQWTENLRSKLNPLRSPTPAKTP